MVLDDLRTLATRESGLKSLQINAQRRVDWTPVAAEWIAAIAELLRARLRGDYEGT